MKAALLPQSRDLLAEASRAAAAGQPLVVQVDLKHCPFCRIVRENFLGPMHRDEGLPVVQIDLQGDIAVRDVQGRASVHRDVARAWGVKLAPTVLFLGPKGTEIAERLVGGMLPDFYGAYLDERLRTARAALKP